MKIKHCPFCNKQIKITHYIYHCNCNNDFYITYYNNNTLLEISYTLNDFHISIEDTNRLLISKEYNLLHQSILNIDLKEKFNITVKDNQETISKIINIANKYLRLDLYR